MLQLLKKAGWKGRGGLGAHEQGIEVPIEAWVQAGRRGIGTEQAAKAQQDAKDNASEAAAASEPGGDKAGTKPAAPKRAKAPKREWESVRVEESTDTKVKRWRQVMQVCIAAHIPSSLASLLQ